MSDEHSEQRETDAAAEAGAIGGSPSDAESSDAEPRDTAADEAERPLAEAGQSDGDAALRLAAGAGSGSRA